MDDTKGEGKTRETRRLNPSHLAVGETVDETPRAELAPVKMSTTLHVYIDRGSLLLYFWIVSMHARVTRICNVTALRSERSERIDESAVRVAVPVSH